MSVTRQWGWMVFAGAVAIFCGAVAFFNGRLTRYVEADRFREMLESETAKGLHFPSGKYAPIRRTGFLTAATDRFDAEAGAKAMLTLHARGISAEFNPLALSLRRWQFDAMHIQSGEVELHIYKHVPEAPPAKPWSAIFLPDRVYLKSIDTDSADVTWLFRGRPAGFFGTRLLVTPHGRDFNYQATGGELRMASVPNLSLRRARLLITKTLLTVYDADLAPNQQSEAAIRAHGHAGLGEDRSVDLEIDFDRLPVDDWLPSSWKGRFSGLATGKVHWTGQNPKLENSSGKGSLRIIDARVEHPPFLQRSAAAEKLFGYLQLNDCSMEVAWSYPKIDIRNIAIEEKGKFRVEGGISIDHDSLGGTIELGIARKYLDGLPEPEKVFTQERAGYLWATVHLSGTVGEPKEDLSPRIAEAIKESPGAWLDLLAREIRQWLKDVFGGD